MSTVTGMLALGVAAIVALFGLLAAVWLGAAIAARQDRVPAASLLAYTAAASAALAYAGMRLLETGGQQ